MHCKTKVQKLSDANLKLAKFLENKKEKENKGAKDKSKQDNDKWAWKKIPPKQGKPTTKKVDNKTYHWCTHHKVWVVNNPSEYRLKPSDTTNPLRTNNSAETEPPGRVQATQALVTDVLNSIQEE